MYYKLLVRHKDIYISELGEYSEVDEETFPTLKDALDAEEDIVYDVLHAGFDPDEIVVGQFDEQNNLVQIHQPETV
jgi:hypothetical protein